MMKLIGFLFLNWLLIGNLIAQKRTTEWQLAYFAPYVVGIGSTIGYAVDLKNTSEDLKFEKKHHHRIGFISQVSFFSNFNVSNNLFFNPEVYYKWNKIDKRFFLSTSIGTGYLISFQRQDGTLDLATGEMEYNIKSMNYFLPTLNLGLGIDPKKHIGFFAKFSYGRKFSLQNPNSSFFAITTGIILRLKKSTND